MFVGASHIYISSHDLRVLMGLYADTPGPTAAAAWPIAVRAALPRSRGQPLAPRRRRWPIAAWGGPNPSQSPPTALGPSFVVPFTLNALAVASENAHKTCFQKVCVELGIIFVCGKHINLAGNL